MVELRPLVATMVPDPTNQTPGGYSYIRQVDSCFVEPDPV